MDIVEYRSTVEYSKNAWVVLAPMELVRNSNRSPNPDPDPDPITLTLTLEPITLEP